MLKLSLDNLTENGSICCLGAHCDDIEIGCGAMLVDLLERFPGVHIHAITFSSDDRREAECRNSFSQLLGKDANLTLSFARFRDGYLPHSATEVKDFLIQNTQGLSPELVVTHSRQDLHQDHRFIGELSYQVFRDSLILEMEILKYDGDLDRPNVYFPVSAAAAAKKINCLTECYESQRDKHWFSEDSFRSLMRIRGVECRSKTGLAEGFSSSKLVLA